MFEKAKKFSKFVKDILQPIYFAVWLLLILASIIPQVYPIFFNPLVVEGAKYVTIVLISVFGSYLLLKRSERKIGGFKGTLGETEKKIEELRTRTDKASQEIDKLTGEFKNFKIDQERKYKDLYSEVGQFINDVSKLNALNQKNQQTLSILSERLERFFFIKCPQCNTRIALDFPNTIISGIHEVDGQASDNTFRDTKELDLQCPQCRRKYHIDIPHSELIKI
jgi:hypothetical protein